LYKAFDPTRNSIDISRVNDINAAADQASAFISGRAQSTKPDAGRKQNLDELLNIPCFRAPDPNHDIRRILRNQSLAKSGKSYVVNNMGFHKAPSPAIRRFTDLHKNYYKEAEKHFTKLERQQVNQSPAADKNQPRSQAAEP